MLQRQASRFLLCAVVLTIAAPSWASTAASEVEVAHHEGVHSPCPDGDTGPCEDDCPCLCCPGHAFAVSLPQPLSLTRIVPVSLLRRGAPTERHPAGVLRGVFRPPRA